MNLAPKTLLDILIKMVIPVFAGYIATKARVMTEDYPDKISTLVLYVCQPFMLVSALLGIEASAENINAGLTVLAVAFIALAIAALIAFVSTLFYKDKKKGRIIEHCTIFGNCGFFGIPVVRAVFGDIGVFYAGFFIAAFNIIMWSYGIFVISRADRAIGINLKKIFFNAGTVPCCIGLILFFTGVPVYGPVLDGMRMIGDACTPLSMIIVGAMLARIPARKLLTSPSTYYVCLVKLALIPTATAFVLSVLGFSDTFAIFGSLMMALPAASSSAMFAQKYSLQPELAAHTVGMTTIASVGTIPVIMQLVKLIVYAF